MRRLALTFSWPIYSSSRRGRRLLSRMASSSLTWGERMRSATTRRSFYASTLLHVLHLAPERVFYRFFSPLYQKDATSESGLAAEGRAYGGGRLRAPGGCATTPACAGFPPHPRYAPGPEQVAVLYCLLQAVAL